MYTTMGKSDNEKKTIHFKREISQSKTCGETLQSPYFK